MHIDMTNAYNDTFFLSNGTGEPYAVWQMKQHSETDSIIESVMSFKEAFASVGFGILVLMVSY